MIALLPVFLGGTLRHTTALARAFGREFHWATLIINFTGSVILGLIAGYFAFKSTAAGMQDWWLFLTTGMLGGYMTLSTFSLDAPLWERGAILAAAAYVVISAALSSVGLFGILAPVRALT